MAKIEKKDAGGANTDDAQGKEQEKDPGIVSLRQTLSQSITGGKEIPASQASLISEIHKGGVNDDDPLWYILLPVILQHPGVDYGGVVEDLREAVSKAAKDIKIGDEDILRLAKSVASRLELKPPVLDEDVIAEALTRKLGGEVERLIKNALESLKQADTSTQPAQQVSVPVQVDYGKVEQIVDKAVGEPGLLNEVDRRVRKALLDLQPAVLVDYGKVEQIVDKTVGKAMEETVGRSLRDKNLLVSVSIGLAVVSLLGFLMFQSNSEKSGEIAKLQGQVQLLQSGKAR